MLPFSSYAIATGSLSSGSWAIRSRRKPCSTVNVLAASLGSNGHSRSIPEESSPATCTVSCGSAGRPHRSQHNSDAVSPMGCLRVTWSPWPRCGRQSYCSKCHSSFVNSHLFGQQVLSPKWRCPTNTSYHISLLASRAPSARAANLAHTIVGWISGSVLANDEKPQSLPPMTLSLPTMLAKRRKR